MVRSYHFVSSTSSYDVQLIQLALSIYYSVDIGAGFEVRVKRDIKIAVLPLRFSLCEIFKPEVA